MKIIFALSVLLVLTMIPAFGQSLITFNVDTTTLVPGEIVEITGKVGAGLEEQPVAIEIVDVGGKVILIRTVVSDANGDFVLKFKVPQNVESGDFEIVTNVEVEGESISTSKSVEVTELKQTMTKSSTTDSESLGIASFVDQSKDPQYYIDRYNNEPSYKDWFERNYPQYESIYQAVGLPEPPGYVQFLEYLEISAFDSSLNTNLKPYSKLTKYSDSVNGFSIDYPSTLSVTKNYSSGHGSDGWVKFSSDPVADIFHFSVYGILPYTFSTDANLMEKQEFQIKNQFGMFDVEIKDQYVIKKDELKHFMMDLIVTSEKDGYFSYHKIDWVLVNDKIIEINSELNLLPIVVATKFVNPELDNLYMGDEIFADYAERKHEEIFLTFYYDAEPKSIVTESEPEPKCGAGTTLKDGVCVIDKSQATETKSRGGGCLIATATFDSELAPQVQKLREIRDSKLLYTESGTQFMESFNSFYYSFSPIIADYERENPVFKEMVKIGITPMISTLSLMDYANTESEVLTIGISLIILNAMMYVGLPVFGIMIAMKSKTICEKNS